MLPTVVLLSSTVAEFTPHLMRGTLVLW